MKRTARITDVARMAGVSIATVSYVLNDRGRVSPATRERVYEAVAALGYHPSARARSLVLRRTRTVGVMEPAALLPSDPSFALFLAGVAEACRLREYHVMLIAPTTAAPDGHDLASIAQSGLIDGAIVMGAQDPASLEALDAVELPYVVYGGQSDKPWVDVDHTVGTELATRHLLDFGHQRIAHVALPAASAVGRLRRLGYERALAGAGLGLDPIVAASDGTFEGGYRATALLLGLAARCTGIVAASDTLALGAMKSASDLGVDIPRQLSVVGFGDTWSARHAEPALTSVTYDLEALGQAAAERLLDLLEGGRPSSWALRPRLVPRASAGPSGFVGTPSTNHAEPVLKVGPTFALWSQQGTFEVSAGRHGIYLADTRLVSAYQLWIEGQPAEPLALKVSGEGRTLEALYLWQAPASTLRLERQATLSESGLCERWVWQRWGEPHTAALRLQVGSDFADVFEIRGTARRAHGERRDAPEPAGRRMEYQGRDGLARVVTIRTAPPPTVLPDDSYQWELAPEDASGTVNIELAWQQPAWDPVPVRPAQDAWPAIRTGNFDTDAVMAQAGRDLDLLATDFGCGPVPMAGLPWFGTLFGRDALTVGWQTLAWRPQLAVRVLATLARYQGTRINPDTEEEPGKIVHEVRMGEMARTGEVPFGRYYGSVDATPLFVALFGATWQRLGDDPAIERLWPSVEAALDWLWEHIDADGLCRFEPQSKRGLAVQSWKDSADSMVFADGQHGHPPLAVAEVQGYAYAALALMAHFLEQRGGAPRASRLRERAAAVRQAFHRHFWLPERQFYALAVDGRGAAVDGLASDPGQCLWSGVVPDKALAAVVKRLTSAELWTGWGIRTLGAKEAAYDPYSYHRGSVWPHDTSLIAAGLRQAGQAEAAARVAQGLLEAAARFPKHQLPELFAGEARERGGPFPYPTACAPQAWASAAPYLALQALCGLEVDARQRVVRLAPVLTPTAPDLSAEGVEVDGHPVRLVCSPALVEVQGLPAGWRSECLPARPLGAP